MPDDLHGPNGDPSVDGQEPHDRTNGARTGDGQAHPVPFDELSDPVDLVAVQADDELINALAAGMSVSSSGAQSRDADDRVTAILAAWKADVDTAPTPELVDVDTGVSTVLAARPRSSRGRHLVPVAAAAAFLVFVVGGVSVSSYNAEPEDALWGVSKVLYSERAESVEAAARVEDRIASAKEALVAGQSVRAARELARAESDLAAVRPQEGQDELTEAQDFLEAKAAETPPGRSVDPAAPLATEPSRPVPQSVREPQPSSPESAGSGASETAGTSPTSGASGTSETAQRPSGTQQPEGGPEVASTPGEGTGSHTPEQPTSDPRRAQVAPPPDSGTAPTSSPPSPDGTDEGERDQSTEPTGSPSTTATPDGEPDTATTSPEPPPSSGGDGESPSVAEAEPAPNGG